MTIFCNHTRNEHFAYLKQAAKSNFAFTKILFRRLHIYKINCFIYVIFIVTCKPNLYVLIDKGGNFACSFYNNYKFSVVQKILYTPWPRNLLKFSRLFTSAASGLGDNFSLGILKNDFAALVYK
jgi:hypothetical protein